MIELNKLYNCDCMELMKEIPDKYFELAIVDPPYGGGADVANNSNEELSGGVQTGRIEREDDSAACLTNIISKVNHAYGGVFAKYQKTTGGIFDKDISVERTGGTWAAKYGKDINHWDIAPPPEYFNELARVSQNQIIWGGNYFDLPPTRCFIVWRKKQIPLEGFSMSPVEYAWTSFNANGAMYECFSSSFKGKEERFHPSQKPVELYQWILNRFAKDGDKILDTHAGSASSLIACHNLGFDFVGCEIDEVYYKHANERLKTAQQQITLFQ